MEKRIAVVGIIIEDIEKSMEVNEILHEFGSIIVGRIGIPYRDKGISVISIIIDGSVDDISAMTGRIGKLKGVSVKAAITKK
jgi:putative iron-only hydrogenase system regulator